MLIKPRPLSDIDSSLPAGTLVTYEQDGGLFLGMILGYKKPKYQLLNMRAREAELVPERLHKLPYDKAVDQLKERTQKTEFLAALHSSAEVEAAKIDLEEIWSLLRTDQGVYDTAAICNAYYGANQLRQHYALRYALLNDKIYFKRHKETFECRPEETVAELKKAEEARQQKFAAREITLEAFRARLKDPKHTIAPQAWPIIELLEDIAVDAPHLSNQQKKEGKEILEYLVGELKLDAPAGIPPRAYTLLTKVNIFGALTNVALIRFRPPRAFPEVVLQEADQLDPLSFSRDGREDLTALNCFTIDDATTEDMDDALSLEQHQEGYRLGIHITDVASLIPVNSELDQESAYRASSIYGADIVINMLPPLISEQKLSLRPGEIRAVTTFFFEVSKDYKIVSSRITQAYIKVSQRLSYDQVDNLLEGERADLNTLYNIASELEALRFANGGFKVNKRDISIKIGADGRVELSELDENAPSRSMVAELMVLTNQAAADFCAKNGIAIPFRGQPKPEPLKEDLASAVPDGPARDYLVRARLQRSSTSLTPSHHATLGIPAYTQVTSPIRRYLDLCVQRQINTFLTTGKPQFSAQEMQEIIGKSEESLKLAMLVTKEVKRFWLLRYLEQLAVKHEKLSATVIRNDHSNPMIELDRVYFPQIIKLNRSVKLGEELRLRIVSVDARYDYLRLEE